MGPRRGGALSESAGVKESNEGETGVQGPGRRPIPASPPPPTPHPLHLRDGGEGVCGELKPIEERLVCVPPSSLPASSLIRRGLQLLKPSRKKMFISLLDIKGLQWKGMVVTTFQIINRNDQYVLLGKEGQYFIYKEIQHSLFTRRRKKTSLVWKTQPAASTCSLDLSFNPCQREVYGRRAETDVDSQRRVLFIVATFTQRRWPGHVLVGPSPYLRTTKGSKTFRMASLIDSLQLPISKLDNRRKMQTKPNRVIMESLPLALFMILEKWQQHRKRRLEDQKCSIIFRREDANW